jgi:hypothetical protein
MMAMLKYYYRSRFFKPSRHQRDQHPSGNITSLANDGRAKPVELSSHGSLLF